MKEGLLGATLSVSSRSEREEARSHVARWSGSESTPARRLPGRRGGWALGGDGGAVGCRRLARPGRPIGRPSGARGHRVDERRAVRARHLGGARLGGTRGRRAEGQGLAPLACKTDRIDARVETVRRTVCEAEATFGGQPGNRSPKW